MDPEPVCEMLTLCPDPLNPVAIFPFMSKATDVIRKGVPADWSLMETIPKPTTEPGSTLKYPEIPERPDPEAVI